MGEICFSQEILEHVLQYADGETLLKCKEVSPEFAAAVKYLTRTKNIWEKCYAKEKGDNYPYCVISKLHPHSEGFQHQKNWGLIYESSFLKNIITAISSPPSVKEFRVCKDYSSIQDLETHEDLILVLVKYNNDFSIYHRIITINLQNIVVDKSCRFYAEMLYITPIRDPSNIKRDAIILSCDYCQLAAVPVSSDTSVAGYPKFSKNYDFLTVEHSNGEMLWINRFGKLMTQGNCFHSGTNARHEEIKLKDSRTIKVFFGFTTLFVSCGETKKEFNTFKDLRANVTAYLVYADVLILGTDTGMLYAYGLKDESALTALDLKCFIWRFSVCSNSILVINVMELKKQFTVVCCSEKTVYFVHINRKLQNFPL